MSHVGTWPLAVTEERTAERVHWSWVVFLQAALFIVFAVTLVYDRGTFEQGFARAQLLSGYNALVLGSITAALVFLSLLLPAWDAGLLVIGLLACSLSVSVGVSGFALDLPVQPVLLINLPRLIVRSLDNRKASTGWMWAFIVLVVASAFACEEPMLALRSTIRFITYLAGGVTLGLVVGARPEHTRRALVLLASGATLIALRALAGLISGAESVNDLGLNFAMPFVQDRGSGTAVLLFGVTSAWALLRRKPRRRERIILWLSVAASLTVVILAGARAAYIGLLAAVLFGAAAFSIRYTRRLLGIALVCVLAGGALATWDPGYLDSLADRYTSLVNYASEGRDFQAYDRFDYWNAAVDIAFEHPTLGVGYDQFSVRAFDYGAVRYGLSAHNEYLKILSECGFLALGIYVILLLRTIHLGARLGRIGGHWHLIEAATVGIFCYSVQAFFNNFQQVSKVMVPYFFFVGIVESFRGHLPDRRKA